MMQTSLASKLRVLRAQHGYTLVEASQKTGVDRGTLSNLERGVHGAYTPTISKLAKGYGVPVEDLLEEPAPTGKAEASPSPEPGLALEEADEERRLPLTGPWKAHMLERARRWEKIATDPDEEMFSDLVAAILWATETELESLSLLGVLKQVHDWLNREAWERRLSYEEYQRSVVDLVEGYAALNRALVQANERLDKELEAGGREILRQAEVRPLKENLDKLTRQREKTALVLSSGGFGA